MRHFWRPLIDPPFSKSLDRLPRHTRLNPSASLRLLPYFGLASLALALGVILRGSSTRSSFPDGDDRSNSARHSSEGRWSDAGELFFAVECPMGFVAFSSANSEKLPGTSKSDGKAPGRPLRHLGSLKAPTSSPIEGSDKRRFYAVRQLWAIRSLPDAVRATIVAEHRNRA
jgi:hypothetical protein